MTRLFVDIGNSALKAWQVQAGGTVIKHDAQRHNGRPVSRLLALMGEAVGVQEVVLASVLGADVVDELRQALAARQVRVRELRSVAATAGVRNGYRIPERLGIDRWLGVLAVAEPGAPACVVDCGTATTIDVVDAMGDHRGGYILPGLAMMVASLCQGTVAAQGGDWVSGGIEPGQDTQEAISHGAILATVGAVERTCALFGGGGSLQVVVTGGAGKLLLPHLRPGARYEPDLVLAGMLRYVSGDNGVG